MKYVCQICGYVYDEEKEAMPFQSLEKCPVCQQPASHFRPLREDKEGGRPLENTASAGACAEGFRQEPQDPAQEERKAAPAPAYDPELVRKDPSARYMEEIQEMAVKGESLHAAMGTLLPLPRWEDILLMGAQLHPAPLDDDAPVSTRTVIEKRRKS